MPAYSPTPLSSPAAIAEFERAAPFAERQPARGIYDVFVASAERYPERTALTMVMTGADDEQPRRLTYRALLGQIRQAANMFAALGNGRPGVAYLLPSLVETHLVLWGAETAGYAVPINFLLQADHIAELIQVSGATVLVALGPHPQLDIWEKAQAVKAMIPGLTLMRVAPPGTPPADGVLDFHATLATYPADHLSVTPGRDDDIAAYFHTGGTTGTPKLVAHTHRSQLVAAFGGAAMLGMCETDVLPSGFPLFHVAGTIVAGLSCFMSGVEVVILSPGGFRNPAMVSNFWRIAARYRATLLGAVPTALAAVLETPLDGADISSVRLGLCGAASLPRAVGERFERVTGKPLHEILGMTESSGLTCIDPAGAERGPGSVGFPLPYTEVVIRRRLADGSLGEPCAAGEIGVLTVRGPSVSPGYKSPEQNKGVFHDGLLNSGDLAYTDAAGRIYIAGRAKDLIIRSGHNIDPVMIENAMATHPAVALVAAVAQPDAYAGELPVCYVTLRPGATATEAELHAHAERHIAERPAWPKHIYIVDAIPTTNVGKIYKPQLRVDAAQRLVTRIVGDELGLVQARIDVAEGGKRGMAVSVVLPAAQATAAEAVSAALAGFVFESTVAVA